MIQNIRERDAWWCLDDFDLQGNPLELKLYGSDDMVPYRRIEILYMPCLTFKILTKEKFPMNPKDDVECYADENDRPQVLQ